MTIDLQTNGGITDYFDQPGGINYDFNPNINFSLTYKASPRLTISETTYAVYQNQPDFQDNAGLTRRSGSFFYSSNKFSAAYRWRPRFSTVTSYTIGILQDADNATASYENRFEHTFGNEFRFLLWPTTTVIAEYRFAFLNYEDSVRNSTSNFFLGGLDHNFSPRFSISTRAGVEVLVLSKILALVAIPTSRALCLMRSGPISRWRGIIVILWKNRTFPALRLAPLFAPV